MGEEMTVRVTMPTRVWAQLSAVAERRRCRIGDMVAESVVRLLRITQTGEDAREARRAALAVEMYEEGIPTSNIAFVLREDRGTVIGWLEDAGYTAAEDVRQHALDLLEAGGSVSAVAAAVGVAPGTLSRWRAEGSKRAGS